MMYCVVLLLDFRVDRATLSKVSIAPTGVETLEEPFQIQRNEFFKKPVPNVIRQSVSLFHEASPEKDLDVVALLTAAPSVPGSPRPLWLVLLESLPTGLLWGMGTTSLL